MREQSREAMSRWRRRIRWLWAGDSRCWGLDLKQDEEKGLPPEDGLLLGARRLVWRNEGE